MGFVERMKWWQWIALSLGLGALLGYLNSGGADPPVEHSSVSPMVFESGLMQPPYVDPTNPAHRQAMVSGIVVHPRQEIRVGGKMVQVQLVTFNALDPHRPGHPSGATERVSMLAPYPYEPQPRREPTEDRPEWPAASMYYGQSGDTLESLAAHFYHKATAQGVKAIVSANDTLRAARNAAELKINEGQAYWIPWNPADGHTISDFLLAANELIVRQQGANAIPVSFRYTWWESANHVYAIWMIGSFLVVGVIWPALLQVMVKGGLGRTKPEEFDLRRYKPSPVPSAVAKPTTVVTKDDMQQLREMEEALEASLKASAATSGPAAEPQAQPAAPAIKVLGGSEPAAALPQTPEEPKEYQGEFYPVVRPAEKKTD
ncbi:MAG: hypothetical protein ABSB74_02080 [Tepidisphaeraceae bacterium]